jgi:hypothetical protein
MARDGYDDEEGGDELEDEGNEDEEVVDEGDQDEEEDNDDDDGKEPQVIGQGEIVNSSADDAYTIVDHELIVLSEQGPEMDQRQEMWEHTPRP